MTTTAKRDVTVTIKVQCDGFAGDVEAVCPVDVIPGLIAKLRAAGIEPANSPYLWQQNGTNGNGSSAPLCPVHGKPMKPSKYGGGYYCTSKLPDGSYCKEKGQAA